MPELEITYAGQSSAAVLRRVPADAALILDVGCGNGGNARFLAARGVCVDGVTRSAEEASAARPVCANLYRHDLEGGLPALPDGRRYDAIICSHILEHIVAPDALLDDMRERLTPSGVLIVALPNLLHWKSRLRLLAGRFDYAESGLMDRTHVRWYSFASAARLLSRHGFTVIEATVEGGPPLGPLRRILSKSLLDRIDRAACRIAPGLLGHELLYVARAG